MQDIGTMEFLVEFLKNRYRNYEIVEYHETETRMRQIGEDEHGNAIGECYEELLYDNLGFISKKTKVEEITLSNMGFNSFRGFDNINEIIEFLDKKLKEVSL